MKRFEVLWFEGENEEEAMRSDYYTKEFSTKQAAMNYYEKHKNDSDCYGWWVTKRSLADWSVLEDYVW